MVSDQEWKARALCVKDRKRPTSKSKKGNKWLWQDYLEAAITADMTTDEARRIVQRQMSLY